MFPYFRMEPEGDLLMGYGIPCGALHGRPKRENHSKRQGESEACDHTRASRRQLRTGDQYLPCRWLSQVIPVEKKYWPRELESKTFAPCAHL